MKTFMMTALAAAMASSVAVAEVTVPNAFVQGTNAVADDVNANFQALAAAIDESNSRIAALEEQLEKASSVDVAGLSYAVQSSSVELQKYDADPNNASEDPGFWNIDLYVEKFLLTFNDDANQTVDLDFESEFKGDLWEDGTMRFDVDTTPGSEQLFWAQDGNKLTLSETLGGEVVVEFIVTEGAGVIYALDAEFEENDPGSPTCGDGTQTCYGDFFDSGTLMGIRQSSVQ
ncbi:hypothetical protein A3730_16995 [Alcanivorax sp. HI0044]|nr:hypothetical protein [Alcanivorax sp. HI0044]KZY34043.1 hypothetical protein A3730_16995 [Alcanivorax sp. HI0044]